MLEVVLNVITQPSHLEKKRSIGSVHKCRVVSFLFVCLHCYLKGCPKKTKRRCSAFDKTCIHNLSELVWTLRVPLMWFSTSAVHYSPGNLENSWHLGPTPWGSAELVWEAARATGVDKAPKVTQMYSSGLDH